MEGKTNVELFTSSHPFHITNNNTVIFISIKEDNLTVSVELGQNEEWDYEASCEEALIASLNVLRRIFSERLVTRAYYRVYPESLGLRDEDDPVRVMYEK